MKPLTICVASAKGGTGRSTVTTMLSVYAAREGRTAILDVSADQASSSSWFYRRKDNHNLDLVESTRNLRRDLHALEHLQFSYVLIDCPPILMDTNEAAVMVSDLVVIPMRPTHFDAEGCAAIVELCRRHKKKFVFLINMWTTPPTKASERAVKELSKAGPVLKTRMCLRSSYATAVSSGTVGPEIDAAARKEADAIWSELTKLLGGIRRG